MERTLGSEQLEVAAKPTFRQFGFTFPDSRFYGQVEWT
jgi:hypothetical protein